MGMMTILGSITGQKIIRVHRSYVGLKRISRDDRLSYGFAMMGGFFWVFIGIIIVLFAW